MRRMVGWLMIGALVGGLLAGCAATVSSPPQRAADVRGRILELHAQDAQRTVLLVEYGPAGGAGRDSVTVSAATRLLLQRGDQPVQPASSADLQVGQTVELWYDGAVAESLPRQAHAGVVLIVADGS